MKKVICKKDYSYFEKGLEYYISEEKLWSNGTYSIMYNVLDINGMIIGEIGYLLNEVFEDIHDKRKRIISNLLDEKM